MLRPTDRKLTVRNRKLDSIRPYEGNPRRIPDRGIEKVVASLRQFGPQQPIVVDKQGVIIVGHTRYLAAERLGWSTFPVAVASHLSPEEVRAYRLADNRTHEESQWDNKRLRIELGTLKDLNFDLTLTGFDLPDLGRLLGTDAVNVPGETTPDAPADPVSRPGDLWRLGSHRVLVGDATKAEDVDRLLGGARPVLMVTDPPYGVSYKPEWREQTDGGARATGKVKNDDRFDWSEAWALFPGDAVYVWHDGIYGGEVKASLERHQFMVRAQIVWTKQHFVISRGNYHPQHELCWYAVRKGGKSHWRGGRKQSTVWEIANRGLGGKKDDASTDRSTQKPLQCMLRPIENNSPTGGGVYDPFLGSGTTLIAAEQSGRVCFGLDLEPRWVDVTIMRWQDFTGEAATLADSGRTIADVERERGR